MDTSSTDMLKTALYLDDQRTPVNQLPGYKPWVVVRNYNEFVNYIQEYGVPDFISWDHDLCKEHMEDYFEQVVRMGWQAPSYHLYKEKTGLDCAKFLVEYAQDNKLETFPKGSVHSHNPVGALNIQSYLNGFKKHIGLDQDIYIGRHEFVIADTIKSTS